MGTAEKKHPTGQMNTAKPKPKSCKLMFSERSHDRRCREHLSMLYLRLIRPERYLDSKYPKQVNERATNSRKSHKAIVHILWGLR